jgi:signal transduction histidine kinase
VTFQRKLLIGFSLMTVPVLLIAAVAIRTNVLERAALKDLGEHMSRNRTYAELENAMTEQSGVVWRYLTGMDPTGRQEFTLSGEVIDYWHQRWRAQLRPDEMGLADTMAAIQHQIHAVVLHIFDLYDAGQHKAAYASAQNDLRDGLFPTLANVNRDIYRRQRESSVRGAYDRLTDILAGERRVLVAVLVLSLGVGFLASWLISRGLARPIRTLSQAMAVAGTGDLDHPITSTSHDEIGDLARAFADMTDKLRHARAQLVQSERLASIGEMSAAVAHGLRNPLASLRAASQLALRRTPAGDSREQLADIIDEVDRLDRRVSHLLSFSRPAPVHPRREEVATLIEDLLPTFTALMGERGVALDVELAPSLPPVHVDPMQLEQALVEIISNALDAMPDGGRLRIAAGPDEAHVVIEVTDTGAGIPASVLPMVCDPFFTTRPDGTGLGLAVAKRYIEQNGGRLEITSRPGAGTTVRVWLRA